MNDKLFLPERGRGREKEKDKVGGKTERERRKEKEIEEREMERVGGETVGGGERREMWRGERVKEAIKTWEVSKATLKSQKVPETDQMHKTPSPRLQRL